MSLRKLSIVQATDADVLVKVGSGIYGGVSLLGAAAGTFKVYDSSTVAGVSNAKLMDVGGVTAANASAHSSPCEPIKFTDGLVIVITGAGNLATIFYK